MSAMATAILFPGQGSQTADMRAAVEAHDPALLERCIRLVGEDPFLRVEQSTAFQQPAIFCASIVAWQRLAPHVEPRAMAGHSLGELSALAAAGALSIEAALELVVMRARFMAQVADAQGEGAMVAVLKGTADQTLALVETHDVSLANDNAPGQTVLSGSRPALEAAVEDARAAGMKALWLNVAGAFHSPAMASAAQRFRAALAGTRFRTPDVPVLSCATAALFADPRTELADALVRPVRWRQTMTALADLGMTRFVDVGPGEVLARLVPRTVPDATAHTAEELHGAPA